MQKLAWLALPAQVVAILAAHLQAASITVLPGDLFEGKPRWILQLMPDGKHLMGVAGDEVFRWSNNEGRTVLGRLGPNSIPTAISADGTTVVGRRFPSPYHAQEAFRWTAAGGAVPIPTPPGFSHNPSPAYVSENGSIVYGTAHTHFTEPIADLNSLGLTSDRDLPDQISLDDIKAVTLWDANLGSQSLPAWTSGFGQSRSINGVSANGQSIAGTLSGIPFLQFTSNPPIEAPIDIPNFHFADVTSISADGSTLIGRYMTGTFDGGSRGFRWQNGKSLEPLTDGAEYYSSAHAVSGDGRIILGDFQQEVDNPSYMFVWEEGTGIEPLAEYFLRHGVVLPFVGTHGASEVSRNGLVFWGYTIERTQAADGTYAFKNIPWIVDLTAESVPEPATVVLVAFATAALALRQTERRN